MPIKKFKLLNLLKSEQTSFDEPFTLKAMISNYETNQSAVVTVTADTGASSGVIPAPMVERLGLQNAPQVGTVISEMADGSKQEMPVILISMRLYTTDSNDYTLMDIPYAVAPSGSEMLVGRDVLRLYSFGALNGHLTHFVANVGCMDQLEDWSGEKSWLVRDEFVTRYVAAKVAESNLNQRTNSPQPLKTPKQPVQPTEPRQPASQMPQTQWPGRPQPPAPPQKPK